jgi:glycosidase
MALSVDASFRKVKVGDDKAIYAYVREKGGRKILVILNLSKSEQAISVTDKSLWGTAYNVFSGANDQLTNKEWKMGPWGYAVYEYAPANAN